VSISLEPAVLGHSAQAVTAAITANAAATPGHNHCLFAGRAGAGLGLSSAIHSSACFTSRADCQRRSGSFLQARLHHPVQSFRAHRLQFAYRPWLGPSESMQ